MAIDRDLTRDEVARHVRDVAIRLGKDSISRSEFLRGSDLTEWQVMKHFDTWNDCVDAAGLRRFDANRRLTDDELLAALRDAFLAGGGIVSRTRLRKLGRHSDSVYHTRWGRWPNVLARFRAWALENDPDFPFLADLPDADAAPFVRGQEGRVVVTAGRAWTPSPTRTRYGPFLNFRGLQHAPINEQGVVFLFGIVAFDLGYVVEGVGTGFPDCEAKRCVSRSGDVWERVRIEFEYKSRNFLDHGHPFAECDVLVCWEHNWPDCPIEVLELRSAIESLGDD